MYRSQGATPYTPCSTLHVLLTAVCPCATVTSTAARATSAAYTTVHRAAAPELALGPIAPRARPRFRGPPRPIRSAVARTKPSHKCTPMRLGGVHRDSAAACTHIIIIIIIIIRALSVVCTLSRGCCSPVQAPFTGTVAQARRRAGAQALAHRRLHTPARDKEAGGSSALTLCAPFECRRRIACTLPGVLPPGWLRATARSLLDRCISEALSEAIIYVCGCLPPASTRRHGELGSRGLAGRAAAAGELQVARTSAMSEEDGWAGGSHGLAARGRRGGRRARRRRRRTRRGERARA